MRKIGVVAGIAATALILAGCGSTPAEEEAETGTIRVWLNGTDTPQEARDYLKQTFEAQNPGWTLTIEEQQWTGLVDKLTTALSSSDSPDIVEVGNTQAPGFTSAGAFLDLTDDFPTQGLLPGFVEIGSYEGRFYAAPYYSGARLVFYNKQMYADAGVEVPKTLDEYVANAAKLQAADRDGVYWAGQDWYDALPFIWENGGEIAVFKDGRWDAQLSSPGSLAGLRQVAAITSNVTVADKNGNETDEWVPFYEKRAAAVSVPSWAYWSILYDADKNPNGLKPEEFGYFNLPGKNGGVAKVFAGGSNIAISKNSKHPEQAKKALKIILSEEYQRILAKNGLVPALTSLSNEVAAATPELAKLIADAAVNAKLTPASPKWIDVEESRVLQDLFVQIANGGDVEALAKAADEKIEEILNDV
ncbi:MAG: extracellular solute-binding protein [Micromonosporaceae bacterium]|nr:extracellular solute-binding protein [Micromonosporaceae bacterium]